MTIADKVLGVPIKEAEAWQSLKPGQTIADSGDLAGNRIGPASAMGVVAAPVGESLWYHAGGLFHRIKAVEKHCASMARTLEQGLIELERMIGEMPKR